MIKLKNIDKIESDYYCLPEEMIIHFDMLEINTSCGYFYDSFIKIFTASIFDRPIMFQLIKEDVHKEVVIDQFDTD